MLIKRKLSQKYPSVVALYRKYRTPVADLLWVFVGFAGLFGVCFYLSSDPAFLDILSSPYDWTVEVEFGSLLTFAILFAVLMLMAFLSLVIDLIKLKKSGSPNKE